MKKINFLDQIKKQTISDVNLESALLGPGFYQYMFYRLKFYLVFVGFFYVSILIKTYFLGSDYTSFFLKEIVHLEQFSFWLAQMIWIFIILNELDTIAYLKNQKIKYINLILPVVILVCSSAFLYLYQARLIRFGHLNIYTFVNLAFLFHMATSAVLKIMHGSVYKKRRIYVNVKLIFCVYCLMFVLQIYLWTQIRFWSLPLVYFTKTLLLFLIRFYYYNLVYREEYKETFKTKSLNQLKNLKFEKLFVSIMSLLPDIAVFVSVYFVFFKGFEYGFLFYFLMSLMNARMGQLFFQDFLKYNSPELRLMVFDYKNKVTNLLLVLNSVLYVLTFGVQYFFFNQLNIMIFYTYLISQILLITNLNVMYLISVRKNIHLVVLSMFVSIIVVLSLYMFSLEEFSFCFSVLFLLLFIVLRSIKFNPYVNFDFVKCNSIHGFEFLKKQSVGFNSYSFKLEGLNFKSQLFSNFLSELTPKNQMFLYKKNKQIYICSFKNIDFSPLWPFIRDFKSGIAGKINDKSLTYPVSGHVMLKFVFKLDVVYKGLNSRQKPIYLELKEIFKSSFHVRPLKATIFGESLEVTYHLGAISEIKMSVDRNANA